MKKGYILFWLALAIGLNYTVASAYWAEYGGSVWDSYYCKNPSLFMSGDTPYVIWQETDKAFHHPICVSHYNGLGWVSDGGRLNVGDVMGSLGGNPCLFVHNGTPYAAWQENDTVGKDQIYVKHFTGGVWVQDGGSLNMDASSAASNPSLAVNTANGIQYVAWVESSGGFDRIFVKSHEPFESWIQVGSGSLNYSSVGYSAASPSLAIYNGTPYVAFHESAGSYNRVFVKNFTGGNWVVLGGGLLNVAGFNDAITPSLAIHNGIPYVAWSESDGSGVKQIYVKHFNGTSWVQDGGSLNVNRADAAAAPCLIFDGGIPYVAWRETSGYTNRVYVKYFNGLNWVLIGSGLNNGNAGKFSLAVYNGVPYILQRDDNGAVPKISLKYWTPDYISSVAPAYGVTGKTIQVAVAGSNYSAAPAAKLILSGYPELTAAGSVGRSATDYVFTFNLNGAAAGLYDMQITTADECVRALKRSFTVLAVHSNTVWVMNDLGAVSANQAGESCGLAIGDPDDDGKHELYVATDRLYQMKKYIYGWAAPAALAAATGPYSGVVLADGDKDQIWEAYGITSDNELHQYDTGGWTDTLLGTGGSGAAALTAVTQADIDHDGVIEIYAGGDNGSICRYVKTASWSKTAVSGTPATAVSALTAGDGRNNASRRLFGAHADKKIYEYELIGNSWSVTSLGNALAGTVTGLALGDGNNDGANEIYAACMDGRIYQYRWNGSAWLVEAVGTPGGGAMRGVALGDADSNGRNKVYGACQDGKLYQFAYSAGQWTTRSLNTAGTSLYAVAAGDADNDNFCEVYALGQNNHVYQFKTAAAATPAPTATPNSTPLATSTPLPPQKYLKIYNGQINPLHHEQAVIRWTQPQNGSVSITIYNLLGDKIITLQDHQNFSAGAYHEVNWDGRDENGKVVGSGIYIVHLQAGNYQERAKIAAIK